MSTPENPTPAPTTDKPPRRRRWIPLSLRMFVLILVLVTGVSCWQIYWRQVAIREIERTGGRFIASSPRGPQWLRDYLGAKWSRALDRFDYVQLGPEADDSTVADVAALSEIETLFLVDSQRVTDAGLVHLPKIPNLRDLALPPNVTDAGLRHLSAMTGLRDLLLDKTQITDIGLTHLKNLTRLQGLHLSGTKVTDAGLAQLTGMVMLDWLDLSHTPVTDAGLESLKRLPMLRGLELTSTRVSDSGLLCLKGFPHLDRGPLARGFDRGQVTLNDTLVTYEGYRHLVTSLPNVGVYHSAYFAEDYRRKVELMQLRLNQARQSAPR